MYIDHHIKQVGKVLTCTDSSGKIVINKYDNKTSRIIFDLDGTIPGKLYFALLNPTTKKYFLTPINNNEIEITSAISVYPGLWSAIIIGADANYEIIDNNIDQTKLTYISDEFKKIVVRDNFLNELNIEETQSPANLFDFLSEAQGYVVLSKRYAVGDEKIEGSDIDNAKYYMNETKKLLNNFEGTVKDTVVEVVGNQMDILGNEIDRVDSELNQALSETNQSVEELNDELYHFKINTEERIKTLEELDIDVDITVDSELNPESENPIQNKAVAKAVDDLKSETSSLRSDLEKKQPVGDYALRSEIPSIPVESVNGKTGAVVLNATDVGAVTYEEFANFNVNYGNHSHTAEEIGAATSDEVSLLRSDLEKKAEKSEITSHNTSKESHTDIRSLIDGLAARLNALANSDDTTLDQMAEVVAYIKSNKSLIDAITTSKVNVSDIIDNLTTSASNKPLSAKQGVALKALIDAITIPVKSVNGKTGAVSLTATDVGAASATEFAKVKSDFNEHTGNTTSHVTATEKEAWNNKSNFSGSYNDLSNKPTIPTKTSQLTNDSRFLTQHQSLSGYAKTSDIPTKTSQLINDSKFLTGYTETDPTVPAWAKAATKPTYTAAEVGAATQAYVDAETAKLKSDFMEFTVEGEVPINICNEIYEYGRFGSDGVDIEAGYVGAFRTAAYLKVLGGKTIKAVMGQNATFSATAPIQLVQYNADKEIIVPRVDFFATKSNGNITSSSKTPQELTLNDETVYIRFDVCNWGNVGALEDVQVGLYYVDDEVEDYLPHSITKTETFLNPEKIKGLNTLNATGVKTFPDVEAMKNSLDVKVGDVCETLGYYTSGDGGGTVYTIVSGLDTAKYQILLANGLYASLTHDESINVKCLGAVCDASTDNHDVFQKAFDIATKAVIIPSGTYQLKTPVNVSGKSNFSIYAQDSNIRYWGSEDYAFRFTNIDQCDLYFGNINCFNGGSGVEIYSENGDNPVQYVNVHFRSVSSDTNAFYLHASEDVTHGQVTEVRFHKGRVLGYNGIKGVGFKIVNEGGCVDHFIFDHVGIEGVDTGFHFEGLLDGHPTGNPTFGYCRMIEITNCRMCESFNTLIKTVGLVSQIKIDSSVYLKPSFFDFGNLTDYCYINGAICDEGYGQTGWKAYVYKGIIVPVNEAEERYEDNVVVDLNNLNVFTLPSRMIIPDTLETLKLSIQYGLRDYGINEFELILNGVNSNFKVLDHEENVVFNNVSNLNEGDMLRFKWRYISGWTVEKLNTIALTT